jgi:hypothetical protein
MELSKLNLQNKKIFIARLTALFLISLNVSCQDDITVVTVNPTGNKPNTPVTNVKPAATPKPAASPSKKPDEPDDNEIIGTDTDVTKSNVDWKVYNPFIKGKKYTYVYSIKEGNDTVQTDILREITEVEDKSYTFKQTILTSSKESQFTSTEISVQLNNDFSPPIIPPNSVGGASITPVSQVEISEKPEKVKVPFKEFDAIKVTAKSGTTTTTNWYGKDTGMIKAIQVTKTETHTLELKEYK